MLMRLLRKACCFILFAGCKEGEAFADVLCFIGDSISDE